MHNAILGQSPCDSVSLSCLLVRVARGSQALLLHFIAFIAFALLAIMKSGNMNDPYTMPMMAPEELDALLAELKVRCKAEHDRQAVRQVALLDPPCRLAVAIFRDSMRAFANGDSELARTLKLKDRELDAVTRGLSEKIVARAIVDSELVPRYLDLIFVARALEHIRDHARNMAEDSFWRDQAPTFVTQTARS